ncbi:DUF7359 domain-containing protein [Bacillus altitudinis]|uniref:DUF7359 domain-containing protein n=1 Tax=Bacillus TaxID=1386 RepID=UPI00227F1515|nr:hypothetical protein [Bacillus altitudinis]MCY7579474.1 hypothetical protein [Bacillus altitudinis]MCY7594178.1 hypothetical protein [Bacillus altitudinis]WJE32044.1 hypothetical protein QRD87_09225 [Bacillus altitudinis]WQH40586.1 hypothetical protein U2873_08765 [Bacillus altitudinis]
MIDASISITITNGKKAKEEYDFIQLFYKADKVSIEFNTRKIDYDKLATNYNARNDRISIPPSPPTIGVKSISHKVNENGSVDISVSWNYPSSEEDKYNIDGFIVHCYPDTSSDPYLFGASLAKEQRISVRYDKRIATFISQVPTKYFTFGVQAYRNVETSISSSGVLLSDIVQPQTPSENPYRPSSTVEVKGKVNGMYQISTNEKPSNPDVGTLWIDPATNKSELYDGEQWIVQTAGSADSLNGITTAVHEAPNTIPVRDDNGVISASISGNAMKLGGLEATEYVLKSDVLNKAVYMSGEYIGDGTIGRQINLSFTPKTVKIYSTSIEDSSLHITLNSFGYINQLTNGNLILVGGTDAYGSIGINLFKTGSDQALRGNKPNVKYLWDAWG